MALVQSDQKTSKFFVSHQKESMAGHMGVNEIKLGKRNTKRSMVGPRWKLEHQRAYVSAQVLL
jgi:hypothetical protein